MTALAVRPIDIQRRLTELGRIRLGEKGTRGEPKQLATFRLTSASSRLLEACAVIYGGRVRPWAGAPDEGYFELTTTATELDILIPPSLASSSQSYELWEAGGILRRCDGITESVSGEPCLCDPSHRVCQITTRVSVMLPRVPGLGVWRLDSKGWNAAATLPLTLEVLGRLAPDRWIPAVLRIERRSVKRRVDGKPQTRRFVVPVIDIVGGTIGDVIAGGADLGPVKAIEGPVERRQRVPRPALPPGPPPPKDVGRFEGEAGAPLSQWRYVPQPALPAPHEADVPPPSVPAAEATPPPSSAATGPCDGFSPELGRCVRESHPSTSNHRNKGGESWR
jgi:hypothetical protein